MASDQKKRLRCAIYTRKSHEEGLEQDFNSLHAQREACEAYIRSQAGEGWQLVRAAYDDGAYSGGTMERPALQRLLVDIRDGRIDTVVVYKVDRLTRSLSDFARIVEVFDGHGVSFVSVTQQFNTTTSMGRLTLNMLLSFAQFEREVTGERIRDKIAASKKKGMWMGGFVPLGYEPNGRTLTINEAEAETVRTIFRLYLEHGNVRQVKDEADRLGLKTRLRQGADGVVRGARPFSRGYIYKLLGNPIYIGRIAHRDKTYEGQHPAIVDGDVWDAVQAGLATHTRERRARSTEASSLLGKLFDDTGSPLTPTHAVKSGRRYRYYVSRHLVFGPADRPCNRDGGGWRLPAREIERTVADAVRSLLADRSALAHAARESGINAGRIPHLLGAAARWNGDVLQLVERAELGSDIIILLLDVSPLTAEPGQALRHTVAARIRRRGVEMRLVLENPGDGAAAVRPDAALTKAVVRANKWFEDLTSGRAPSITAIAEAEGVSDRYVSHLLPLACLAPEIVEAILVGTQPADLSAEMLIRHTDLPLDWAQQKALLGFD